METRKVAIIGSGPAGYTAGLYNGRALLEPLIFGGFKNGGQLMDTTEVENYPGFPDGIMGPELMMNMRKQAERFGAEIRDVFATAVDFSERPFKIWTNFPEGVLPDDFLRAKPEDLKKFQEQLKSEAGAAVAAEAVIIATGATSIMLGIPGESELLGHGVSTCAVCDAAFYKDRNVFVVGGGDSAMEDTLALTKFAKKITILHRRDEFRASKIMQERVLKSKNVEVMWNTSLEEIIGENMVEKVRINQDGMEKVLDAEGVFIAIGHKPMNQIFAGQVELDDHGYVVTRQSLTQAGIKAAESALNEKGLVDYPSMTSVEGIFAGGDGVDVRYRQAITAAALGCSAAFDTERWLESKEN